MPIVAAIDQSERAELVLEEGERLAMVLDAELHVVHVGEFSVGSLVSGSSEESPNIEDTRAEAQATAEEICAYAGLDREFNAVGLVGNPVEEILEYSEEVSADYIIVSGRKKSPAGKTLFGSVTQSILLDANRPVISVMG